MLCCIVDEKTSIIREKYNQLSWLFNERVRRNWLASEALSLGRGGIERVHEATGVSRNTIRSEIKEIKNGQVLNEERQRKTGAGRKSLKELDPTLLSDLDALIEPETRGDPENPLRWTCKSALRLKEQLNRMGTKVSERSVNQSLHDMGYSLQSNKKTLEGNQHPDRDQQFQFMERKTREFQKTNQPVISVDAKKKENLGQYRNPGREWRPVGDPELVNMHDFPDKNQSKGLPYGGYDVQENTGWVSVGTDHDTAEFAVETIRRWWLSMGRKIYSDAKELLIMADGGGSNGSRHRLWKSELQKLADELGLEITICHFQPGTSKWNKIEHRMFSCISQNWSGRPLTDHQTVVDLIGNTTTKSGLKIECELDKNHYPTGKKISDEQFHELSIKKNSFHGEWNYTIEPNKK